MQKKIISLLLLCSLYSYSQTYPVTISVQMTPPSPIYLSNYANTTTINSPIKLQLLLNDITLSNRQVRLKCYWEGGASFTSKDFIVGAQPLYLEGGFPTMLTNVELGPYFNLNNMLGINPNQYAQPLPEGMYNVCFDVFDFLTKKKLSRKTCTSMVVFQNDPPLLNMPQNNLRIVEKDIQNIVFSWTPRSINVSNVEYEFSLVEIWNVNTPIQNAFAYSQPLYTTTTRSTMLQYGMAEPQLIPGKTYAWRVRAKALQGAEEIGMFKNNGISEVWSFKYIRDCNAPTQIEVSEISEDQTKISWNGDIGNYDYEVKYREKNAQSEWYSLVTKRETLNVTNLKPNTVYEFSVGAACDPKEYTHSSLQEFTTLSKAEIAFEGCGISPDPADLSNQNPLPNLYPSDVVRAGDYPIVVIEATGSNGKFSGRGYVTFPFIEKFSKLINAADNTQGSKIGKNTRIKISFTDIGVNTDFKLISGEIVASYDEKKWDEMTDLDKLANDAFGDTGTVVNIAVDFEIKEVIKNEDGSVTIIGTNGEKATRPPTPNDEILTDKNGNQFAVPADSPAGNIPTSGKVAEGGAPTSSNTNGMTGSGTGSGKVAKVTSADVTVVFSKDNGFYTFDEAPTTRNTDLEKTYENVPTEGGGTYNISYKAISKVSGNDTDIVTVKATFKNGKKKEDIIFKTQNGTAIDAQWTDSNTAKLTLKQTLNFAKESLIATVKTGKDKYDIAGTLYLWHLQPKEVNVTLVSINGAQIPSTAQATLNEIYNIAGVQFKVTTTSKQITNTWGSTVETGDSDLLDTYTNAQQTIITALKQALGSEYKNDTYYMLFLPEGASNADAGFMPLKKQYGFVFDKQPRTLAHELGHGVFGLQHPFKKYNTQKGTTSLLMDYGSGTELNHNDWEIMHAPGLQLYQYTQGDKDGAYNKLAHFALTPSGNVIDDFYLGEKVIDVITKLSIENYTIKKIEYQNMVYEWDSTSKAYVKGLVKITVKSTKTTLDEVNVFRKFKNNECTYNYTTIKWTNADQNSASTDIVKNLIVDKLKNVKEGDWKADPFDIRDISCSNNFINELLANDKKECTITDSEKIILTEALKLKEGNEVANAVNSVCISVIWTLNYKEKETLINLIASQTTIEELSELAILRLMSTIKAENYKAFYAYLEKDNNKVIKHLIKEMNDASIYFLTEKKNYTNFIGALVAMFFQNPASIEDRWPTDDDNFTTRTVNLNPVSYLSEGLLVPMYSEKHNNGKYDLNTGKIIINDVFSVFSTNTGAKLERTEIVAEVSPLTPIVLVSDERNISLVSTALEGMALDKHSYIVPAIFFKYYEEKALNKDIEEVVVTTLDVSTIIFSGGISLATKVTWVRRAWALAEVAGAVGNIAVNSGAVSPENKQVIEAYNAVMGIIGLKDLGQGSVKFFAGLSKETKGLLKQNQSLRALFKEKGDAFISALKKSKEYGKIDDLDDITKNKILNLEKILDDVPKGSLSVDWVSIIGKNIDELVDAPAGYQFYTYNGNKYLRRIDASQLNTPRLTVKVGKIIKYDGQTIASLSTKQINDLAINATKNPTAKKVMLGKYNSEKDKISYNRVAGTDYTYFEMDNWDEIYKLINESDDEIWRINAEFLINQIDANKPIYFSHNPLFADKFFKREVDYITDVLKNRGQKITYIKENQYWKAIW